jgi:hypothetical protein
MKLASKSGKQFSLDFRVDRNSLGKSVAVSMLVHPWIEIELRLNKIKLRNRFTGIYHFFDDGSDEMTLPERLVQSLQNRIGKDLKIVP